MDKQELRIQGKLKKAVIFDCDNTLWSGVVGEDEVILNESIQKDAVFLSQHGVIVGLCSRNNEEDVNLALATQILNDKYLSVKRINWGDKVQNLRDIAEELNIGLDSIVFVDDSPFEINSVRERLPEVLAIYPHELMETVHRWFDLSGDFTKTLQYKEQLARRREQERFGEDYEAYLASLQMEITISVNDFDNIPRIAELTQKTNQFNLTTERFTEKQVWEYMSLFKVFTVSVKDRFGDSGLTAVAMVAAGYIDVFLMSCRIIGRNIEYSLMDFIVEHCRGDNYGTLIGTYKPTAKNGQVAAFYNKFAHRVRENDGEVFFFIDTGRYQKQGRDYICVKEL